MSDLERFRPLAYAIARGYFLPGADEDDVRQEAMIGVWKGLRDYRPDRGTTLRSFVALCVRRQLITALKLARRGKHEVLNRAVYVDTPVAGEEDELTQLGMLVAPGADPARIVEDREYVAAILDVVAHDLTPLERRALIGFANGRSYAEIAEEVGGGHTYWPDGRVRHKRVENALIRARTKLADPPTSAAVAA